MAGLVYLTRHALTEANRRRVRAGLTNISLVPEGHQQAVRLAARLRTAGIEHVWTSPLRRAVETADIIARALHVPITEEPGLIEIDVGPWEGLGDDDVAKRFPDEYAVWRTRPSMLRMPGHESLASVRARAVPVVDRLLEREAPSLCVSHLGVLRVLYLHYAGRSLDEYGTVHIGHCQLLCIRRARDGWSVDLLS